MFVVLRCCRRSVFAEHSSSTHQTWRVLQLLTANNVRINVPCDGAKYGICAHKSWSPLIEGMRCVFCDSSGEDAGFRQGGVQNRFMRKCTGNSPGIERGAN